MRFSRQAFIGLFISIFGTTFGQRNAFDLGMEGGAGMTWLRGNDFINYSHKPAIGFSNGIYFQYNLRKMVSFRAGLAYERKGSSLTMVIYDQSGASLGQGTTVFFR
jgi:hypothetical protein